MKFQIPLFIILTFGFSVHAEPLKFKAWKEQRIVEAQNELLRISARLRSQKASPQSQKATSKDSDLVGANRFQQAPEVTERDLKSAQESLEMAKEFSMEDYAEVYVSSLQNDPEQLTKLMNSLSKDEMAQLMKILVKNKTSEPQRNSDNAPRIKGSPPLASTNLAP